MQPTFRQTPPQNRSSTTATLLPSCAARMAATYPPGPAPRTTTSNRCGIGEPSILGVSKRRECRVAQEGRRIGQEFRALLTVQNPVIERKRQGGHPTWLDPFIGTLADDPRPA